MVKWFNRQPTKILQTRTLELRFRLRPGHSCNPHGMIGDQLGNTWCPRFPTRCRPRECDCWWLSNTSSFWTVNCSRPGRRLHTKNDGKSPCSMRKSTISTGPCSSSQTVCLEGKPPGVFVGTTMIIWAIKYGAPNCCQTAENMALPKMHPQQMKLYHRVFGVLSPSIRSNDALHDFQEVE